MIELQTAKSWNKTPGEWDALDKRDREQMMALSLTEKGMAAWEAHYQSQQVKRAEAKAGRGLKRR